jgi:hypothetical protein
LSPQLPKLRRDVTVSAAVLAGPQPNRDAVQQIQSIGRMPTFCLLFVVHKIVSRLQIRLFGISVVFEETDWPAHAEDAGDDCAGRICSRTYLEGIEKVRLMSRPARRPTRKQFGNGSALCVRLPKSWSAPPRNRGSPTSLSRRLRDVEDSNDRGGQRAQHELFHDLLEALGYRTVGTWDGFKVPDLARKHRPDLILMDIQLPEVSGRSQLMV